MHLFFVITLADILNLRSSQDARHQATHFPHCEPFFPRNWDAFLRWTSVGNFLSDFRRKTAVFNVASAPHHIVARVGPSPAVTGTGSLVYEMIT